MSVNDISAITPLEPVVPAAPVTDLALRPVVDLAQSQQLLMELERFVRSYLHEGEDYGVIPGTPKPTLFKSGADKLCDVYGLADDYSILHVERDFETGLFDYEVKCTLTSKRSGFLVSTGLGSCSSYEGRYRWRESNRKCPQCGKEAVIQGKAEFGGGFVCWRKKDGCGAKFAEDDKRITRQTIGRVANDDLAAVKNTILKMSKKRAKVDAVLSATRSSGLFTQDMEDQPPTTDYTPEATKATRTAIINSKIVELRKKVQEPPTPPETSLEDQLRASLAELPASFEASEHHEEPNGSIEGILGPLQRASNGEIIRRSKKGSEFVVFTVQGEDRVNSIHCFHQGLLGWLQEHTGQRVKALCERKKVGRGEILNLVDISEPGEKPLPF